MNTVKVITIVAILAIGGLALTMYSGANQDSQTAPTAGTANINIDQMEKGDSMNDTINGQEQTATKNIVETAVEAGSFETLLQAATAAGLAETLATTQDLTVFAPTDAAFAALPEGTLESLLADPAKLAEILKYHVVSGKVMAEQVVGLDSATTLEGSDVTVKVSGNNVMINDATVVQADVVASNGVIHVIDKVLLPPM